jgi:hypothetical protein
LHIGHVRRHERDDGARPGAFGLQAPGKAADPVGKGLAGVADPGWTIGQDGSAAGMGKAFKETLGNADGSAMAHPAGNGTLIPPKYCPADKGNSLHSLKRHPPWTDL